VAIGVELRGLRTALARLEQDRRRAAELRRSRVLIGSSLVYAFGIETGRTRSGRLARRAGGARMLGQALAGTRGEIAAALAAARRQGLAPGREVLLALAYRILARAQRLTPVLTGTLRRSLVVREVGR